MIDKRLFVAIEIPPPVDQRLADLDPKLRGVRWLAPKQMHLTLGFLGNITPETRDRLSSALAGIHWSPFFLPVTGIGCFPTRGHPMVVWAGVGRGHPHLFQLHKRVQDAALAAGVEPELRPWRPHITIGRCRDVSAQTPRPFLQKHSEFEAGMIHVESFVLNSSLLMPGGSVYTRELIVPA